MEQFTPVSALVGGALIGLAAATLLWLNGRIAGVSGIFGGILAAPSAETGWRVLFLVGLVAGAALYVALDPAGYTPRTGFPPALLVLGGFLVGFGTRMGGGCTSGHGVCGVARLSLRSVAATTVFLATGMATVFLVRHVLGVQL
ncbi:MAG TPA: YeeE/YedE family protein [Burkholderiales bacterium]